MLTQQHRSLNRFAFCLKTHDLTDHIINSPIHKSDIHKTLKKNSPTSNACLPPYGYPQIRTVSDNGQRVINIFFAAAISVALSNPLEAMCFASVLINSKKQPNDRYDKDNSADDKDGNKDISSACEEIKFLQVKAPLFNTPHNSGKIQKNDNGHAAREIIARTLCKIPITLAF